MAHDIAEGAAVGADHLERPGPLRRQIEQNRRCQFGRGREAVLQVLVPLAEDLQVQRDHQRVAAGVLSPLNDVVSELFVPHHVELEPEGGFCGLRHILDRAD